MDIFARKTALHLLAGLCSVLMVSACSSQNAEKAAAEPTAEPTRTLSDSVSSAPELSVFGHALKDTGLASVFDATASYTVLVPTDAGFAKLGDAGKALLQPEQRAALATVLRAHVLPGYFTPRDIEAAIAAKNGRPVEMRSMGNQTLTFAKDGNGITVTSEDGLSARLEGKPILAGNGVALPIDTVLKAAPPVVASR